MGVHWTKAYLARRKAMLARLEREVRPFADSSEEAAAARRALPFDAWIHTYFPHYASCESSPLHLLADEIVEEKGTPIAEFWFRGAGKTTRALLRRIRRILERRAHFILVGGQTEENAAEKLDLIKLELVHNARLLQDYAGADAAGIAPRAGENSDTDWIAVETRLLARGTGQSCRGLLHGPHRPDDFLGDDLEDDFLARNPQREKHLWEWLFGNVFPALATSEPSSTRGQEEHGEDDGRGEGQSQIGNRNSDIRNRPCSGTWCEILLNNYGTRCAAPGPDLGAWLVQDDRFMSGPESNCITRKWRGTPAEESAGGARQDLARCAPCKQKLLAAMKAVNTSFRISVVIASLNERENLLATVASVKGDCPDAEIIVVDDASDQPEPVAAIRNPRRLGGPRSRRLGALRATGDAIIFLDAHNALDWETANYIARRAPLAAGASAVKIKPEFKEALDQPNKLRALAAAALENNAIAYGNCMSACRRGAACLVPEDGLVGGRWMLRRPELPKLELWPTSWLLGAFYAVPREILDLFGGWPPLPNLHGCQELAVALLAAAHGVKILHHDGVALWHLYRGEKTGVEAPFQTRPEEGSWFGYAAAWRLVLDDALWPDFRARMMAGQGPHGKPPRGAPMPEHVLLRLEADEEMNRFRADIQSRFALKNSEELLEELDRRMRADRETRVIGTEDYTLNYGRKSLLVLTFAACDGTTSTSASLAEKVEILGRSLESARASRADEILISALGDDAGLSAVKRLGCKVLEAGKNPRAAEGDFRALGEMRLLRAALEYALKEDYEWIVKAGGDTFHLRPGWAREMVQRGMAAEHGAALVAGVCSDSGCAATKVFAARVNFLEKTWPEEGEITPLGPHAVLERVWTEKIARRGWEKLWLKLPAHNVREGTAQWWAPDDPAFAYEHTHVATTAAKWKIQTENP